jgi:hypothetical protein
MILFSDHNRRRKIKDQRNSEALRYLIRILSLITETIDGAMHDAPDEPN